MSSIDHEDPRRVLARHGLAPKRSFSQNFLISREAVEKIAEATVASDGATVVELGPGAGTLTTALLRLGASVVAVERDRDMIGLLRTELAGVPGFEVIEGDAAKIDLRGLRDRLGVPYAVAGNLPYSITGEILRHLVESADAFSHAVVMIQKEVRDRLVAAPGDSDYGALTVFVSARMSISPVTIVRKGAFHPPPKVDSAVVRLEPLAVPRAVETPAFRAVVRASFSQRRKMLRKALRAIADGADVDRALSAVGIAGEVRGETLSVESFASLARELSPALSRPEGEGSKT